MGFVKIATNLVVSKQQNFIVSRLWRLEVQSLCCWAQVKDFAGLLPF